MLSIIALCLKSGLTNELALLISSLAAAQSTETIGNKESTNKIKILKVFAAIIKELTVSDKEALKKRKVKSCVENKAEQQSKSAKKHELTLSNDRLSKQLTKFQSALNYSLRQLMK